MLQKTLMLSSSLSLLVSTTSTGVLDKPWTLVDSTDASIGTYRKGNPCIDYLNKGPDSIITYPTTEESIRMYYLKGADSTSLTELYTWAGVKLGSPYSTTATPPGPGDLFPFAQALVSEMIHFFF